MKKHAIYGRRINLSDEIKNWNALFTQEDLVSITRRFNQYGPNPVVDVHQFCYVF